MRVTAPRATSRGILRDSATRSMLPMIERQAGLVPAWERWHMCGGQRHALRDVPAPRALQCNSAWRYMTGQRRALRGRLPSNLTPLQMRSNAV